jgi:HD-GYP domain-containing protein (c-di-GMP phosphodiesterase class II)
VATRSRILACLAASLAVAAPAYAANVDAPGALKKQTTTPEQAAPAPAPQAQAPQAQVPQAQTPHIGTQPAPKAVTAPKAQTNSAPVNKGTLKKLVATPTAAAPAPTTKRAPTAARRRALARGRSHAVPVRAHGTAGAPGRQVAANAPLSAPGHARAAAAKRQAAARKAAAAKKAKEKAGDSAPLTSISQAADRVIEVIPGTVVLALAGLIVLVFMLILRSLTVERQRGKALATSYGVTVEALATAIEAKDHTTGGHIERVRKLGLLLAGEIVPRDARDPQMAYGFLLHDIGKLAVPDAILRAPGRLSEEQWARMRRHPDEGVRMLANVPFLDKALDVVRYHHERWDGGGYPAQLQGEAIPLWARIFAVVDALDAMTAERPYRAARSYEEALEEIRRNAGTQFDPAVVETLERLDPALVEPLLEPTQQVEPLAELPAVGGPLVAA